MNSNLLKKKILVAIYLRMSTEHQKYSIDNQKKYIQQYALIHNMEILYIYDDEGKSGISVSGRNNFNRLIQDVVTQKINIEALLVYDVSRFGRFQDNDEAGYYSYLLKSHGVRIIYCAENIPDSSPEIEMLTLPALRYAAGAYSRNLSIKVFAGHVNLVNRGYFQGGIAGYGLRRKLIDSTHNDKFILQSGERKCLQTDRTILVPGPDDELLIINRIFNMFIFKNYSEYLISEKLNEENIKHSNDTQWTRSKVHNILINERYIGNYVYNKTSKKLKSKKIKNPKEDWIRYSNYFPPIVSPEKYRLAQEIIKNRSIHLSDIDIINYLKKKLKEQGKLSGFIIDEDDTGPSSSIISNRFGGLINAYKLIGYIPERNYSFIEINKELRKKHQTIISEIYKKINISDKIILKDETILINKNLKVSLIISKCKKTPAGNLRWIVRFDRGLLADISIIVRMDSKNKNSVDYFILPSFEIIEKKLHIKEKNSQLIDLYRFDNLNLFLSMLSQDNRRIT
ncbi:recombinase family protein [Proteus appendicitidis]|uniref:Recombinase family protein n=1 Tax=Proteus appendicitidis TaxID=3034648 RepID=A0ABY8Y6D4_9GAMM|nr:recombinase family protein [Proteus sp. HZ0627]WIV87974.1 recombinase family protein [Proteus sp. HZ0627]